MSSSLVQSLKNSRLSGLAKNSLKGGQTTEEIRRDKKRKKEKKEKEERHITVVGQ